MNKKKLSERETHPIETHFIPEGCEVLIMGSFPPKKEHICKEMKIFEGKKIKLPFFYYSSTRNHFWKIMEKVFKLEKGKLFLNKNKLNTRNEIEENIEYKKKFFEDKKIGFVDIYVRIQRKEEWSTNDSDIKPEKFIDIDPILKKNKIKAILFTSKYVKKEFNKKFNENNEFESKYKKISLIRLPTSSGINRRKIEDKGKKYKEILEKYIKIN